MKYNGYKNYETFNVVWWITGTTWVNLIVEGCSNYTEVRDRLRMNGVLETPDQVAYNDSGLDIEALDRVVKEM